MAQHSEINKQSCKMEQQLASALRTLENTQKEFDACKVHLAVSQASISKAQKEIECARIESRHSKDYPSQNSAELVAVKEECASLRQRIIVMETEMKSLRKENCRLSSANWRLEESHQSLMNRCKCQAGIVENQSLEMANIKQEGEEPSDISGISLVNFETPKQEFVPINADEPLASSNKISEFDVQNSKIIEDMDSQDQDHDMFFTPKFEHEENGKEDMLSCCQSDQASTNDHLLQSHRGAPHIQRTGKGNKPFACNECNKRFKQLGNLKRHKLIHTGEKPFKCKWCEKRFNQSNHLTTHEWRHTGEKPYLCETCGFACRHSAALLKHKCSYASRDGS